MKFTREEREMLDGKHGEDVQKALELLVALGECYGADKLLRVSSAHISPVNYINTGKGYTQFIKNLAKKGNKFIIPTTTNNRCMDLWAWEEMGFPQSLRREQLALSEAIRKLGGFLCHTCTPYHVGHTPRLKEHIAWAESSAVIYANAVLGSRTNREAAPTVLAAALTGRTPAFGFHLDENRYGKLKIKVDVNLKGDTEYATLGYFTGKIAEDRVPIFEGLPNSVSQDELKCLGSALATTGSVAHYHVIGVTPEASDEKAARGGMRIGPSDTFQFGPRELRATQEAISRIGAEEADLVVLGCPHSSVDQVKQYAKVLSGRKIKKDVSVWIFVPHLVRRYAEEMGYEEVINTAGARLVSSTCPTAMAPGFLKGLGYRGVATDSPKMSYYALAIQDIPCFCESFENLIDVIATKKKAKGR